MGDVRELDRDECEKLLRSRTVGRLGLVGPVGPEIIPVNYAVEDGDVLVRVSPIGLVAQHAGGARLVLEVDALDHDRWHGWSVVAHGVGQVEQRPDDVPMVRPRPWAGGERTTVVRLTWDRLTGRQVGSGWDVVQRARRGPL